MSSVPLWTPSDQRRNEARVTEFARRFLASADTSDDVWRWSVQDPGSFWRAMWDFAGLAGDPGSRLSEPGQRFHEHLFLPDASLNVAENLLAERPGANEVAIIAHREDGAQRTLSWDDLRQQTAAFASWLRSAGVGPGDRVAAWMPHVPETIVAFLGAASIGAVFTSTSADFGISGVVDRFGQTTPTVLIAADGYKYGGRTFDCLERLAEIRDRLPSVRQVVVVPYIEDDPDLGGIADAMTWGDALDQYLGSVEPSWEQLPGDHPLYVLYSSGTTGKPKCIVHRSGGVLLKHLSESQLHSDVRAGDVVYYFTTCGWMMWNWLVSVLGSGTTIVLHDGNPNHPTSATVFDLIDQWGITLLGVSAKWIDGCLKAGLRPAETHDLETLRTVCSTGSPLSDDGFRWVYESLKPDVHLQSMSGGTDLCGCLVAGDPTKPVHLGEIQRPAFGLNIEVYDDTGLAMGAGEKGELVCTTPFPSMPLGFWGDDDGRRYQRAYFERFDGVWAHGDFASWTDSGGMVIFGRSDATLNASGVRIGTAEIYGIVEGFAEVAEAVAIGQTWEDDTRIVLFLRLVEGAELSAELQAEIRRELRTQCSPRHVPAVIAAVADIPRTHSGKITELAVADVVHGRAVDNAEALANPEALDLFRDRPELAGP